MRSRRQRAIDRALCGVATASDVDHVVGALRRDPGLRRAYDRATVAMRVLEQADLASVEIDWVERMLEADGTFGAPAAEYVPKWWRSPAIIGAALGAAAVAVLVVAPRDPPRDADDLLLPRGGPRADTLALSVLCARGAGPAHERAMVDVSDGTCGIDATIGFAVYVDGSHPGGDHLVLFGVDGRGEVQYYLPTPDQPSVAIVTRGAWVPLQRAVTLEVHHVPDALRVYAALLDRPPTIDEIDAAAATLVGSPDGDDETRWIDRLAPEHPWRRDCAAGRCGSAQVDLRIEPRTP